jgi:L-malate glycosyltransferase
MLVKGGPAPVRIAMLINLPPRKLGSLEDWVIAFAAAAQRAGHTLDIYGLEPIHADVLDQIRLHGAGWSTVTELVRRPLSAALSLASRYDVIHVNLFGLRDRAMIASWAGWPARLLVVDHNSLRTDERGHRSFLQRRLDRFVLARIAAFAGVSQYVRERLSTRFTVHAPRVRTIYNGVDLTRFTPPAERSRAVGDVHILAAAYLIRDKGVDHLLPALTRAGLRRARLTVVGDGPELERLREQSRALGIAERMSFLGLRSDLHLLMRDADIFVHPVLWQEAFGLTVVEAMASGCPVVASRVGAVPELVADRETGILVPPGDRDALAAAVEQLAIDPALRARLGAAGRRRAEERFDLARCVAEHLEWCVKSARRRTEASPAPRPQPTTLVAELPPAKVRVDAPGRRAANETLRSARKP